ncbi:alpha-ketoglutarate-dependent sulfonate dioxygenase [[Candida] railenensis]|uniref:Alpha-ketoglutarate-dependent sulfonate dioxygenase n=1 Tax=[Candida] railenensis TaxID=45579 RepID=A0A9P0QNP5_9ASCO|nr:alpha-ketoglutarate-dependent sulfonate dioxygenase [[Candida] railenensis]
MSPSAAVAAQNKQDAPLNLDELVTKISLLNTSKDPRSTVKGGFADSWVEALPETTRGRYEKYGIDLSKGYPQRPPTENIPIFVDEAFAIREKEQPFVERGKNADPEKKALFGAAKEVKNLTKHIGTEIVGLQLNDLNDKQRDELALLIAERVVVFFRDQDLDPKVQAELGAYYGNVEYHPQQVHVPGLPGATVIWQDLFRHLGLKIGFKNTVKAGTSQWHTDLTHELQPPGITHLHNDAIPDVGGDTVWASGYAAYDKLSPALQQFLDGKKAVYFSAHSYVDRENPLKGRKHVEREHPIIRTHPATGWKSLFVNRAMTSRIVGLEPEESKVILEYLYSIFEKNLDIQVRFNWKPTKPGLGTSALWDNRVSQHFAVWDHEGKEPRHGVRVSSLAEVPYFDPNSKSQREALGLSLD